MKYSALLLVGAVRLASGSPVTLIPRESIGDNTTSTNDPLVVPRPSDAYIEADLDPKNPKTPGAKMTVVRYGPYAVGPMGMLDGLWSFNQEKPCEDCYLTAMQADLQYKDGRSANINEGAWLHHMVIYNGLGFTPGSKKDVVCSGSIYSLGMGYPQRIFASGNERAAVRLNHKHKFGMPVDKGDMFHLLYDLVNQSNEPQTYYIATTFEWVPMSTPGYKPAKMLWVDVTGCFNSEAAAQEGFYELKSPGWKSTIGGALIYTLGHTHDGGVFTELFINDKPVCRSEQMYGTKPAFFEKPGIVNLNAEPLPAGPPGAAHGHSRDVSVPQGEAPTDMYHISEVSTCLDFGVLKEGDNVWIRATYNGTMHKQNMAMHGHNAWFAKPSKYGPVMGIHPVYVAEGLMNP